MDKKIEVLVVDDEMAVRDFLTRFLNFKGIEVKSVEKAEQAIEIIQKEEFDLIFAEISLGRMEGLEAFKKIKKLKPKIKFIITSTYASDEMLEQAKNEGVVFCVKKPFDLEEIISILKGWQFL